MKGTAQTTPVEQGKKGIDLMEAKTLIDVLECLGNGDMDRGLANLKAICAVTERARRLHGDFAPGIVHGASVVNLEVVELLEAARNETWNRAREEALDVIATAIRFLNREWEKDHE